MSRSTQPISSSCFVLQLVYRRARCETFLWKTGFRRCSFLHCCFKVWVFPAPIHLHSPLLFLVKICTGIELWQEKRRNFTTCLCWTLITFWILSTLPKLHNCSPYEMKLILCNVLMSNFNQDWGETALKSGNISASCSKQILWFLHFT